MDPATQLLVNREVSKYRSNLERWYQQVSQAQRDEDAFRHASLEPSISGMLSAMRSIVSADKTRARNRIQRHLQDRVNAMSIEDIQKLRPLMRQTLSGHFPLVYRTIEGRLREKPE